MENNAKGKYSQFLSLLTEKKLVKFWFSNTVALFPKPPYWISAGYSWSEAPQLSHDVLFAFVVYRRKFPKIFHEDDVQ